MQSPYLFTFFLKSILAKSSLQMDSGLAFTFGTFFATPLGVTKSMQRSSPAGFASSRAGPFLGNPHLRHVSLRTDSQTNPPLLPLTIRSILTAVRSAPSLSWSDEL